MIDIGVVYYRMGATSNTIEATWYTSRLEKRETGRGLANGDTSNGFPGEYFVAYFHPDGSKAGTFDLRIEKAGAVYDLSWSQQGKLTHVGVGIEVADGLAAGWRKVE